MGGGSGSSPSLLRKRATLCAAVTSARRTRSGVPEVSALGAMPGPRNPTWSGFATSFNPVRELPPGEQPADWLEKNSDGTANAKVVDSADAERIRGRA